MEKVSYALIRKIEEFEFSKVIDIQKRRDSETQFPNVLGSE